MIHLSVPPKTVAYYSEKSERTVRRMCEKGDLEAELVGGEWVISVPGLKRRFHRLGAEFWKRVCYDIYPDKRDAEIAYQDFLRIKEVAESDERRLSESAGLRPKRK